MTVIMRITNTQPCIHTYTHTTAIFSLFVRSNEWMREWINHTHSHYSSPWSTKTTTNGTRVARVSSDVCVCVCVCGRKSCLKFYSKISVWQEAAAVFYAKVEPAADDAQTFKRTTIMLITIMILNNVIPHFRGLFLYSLEMCRVK